MPDTRVHPKSAVGQREPPGGWRRMARSTGMSLEDLKQKTAIRLAREGGQADVVVGSSPSSAIDGSGSSDQQQQQQRQQHLHQTMH
eukprot:g7336.t1 g7336   contig24:391176-391582(+)